MVEANATKSAETQQSNYTGQNKVTFVVGQKVFQQEESWIPAGLVHGTSSVSKDLSH